MAAKSKSPIKTGSSPQKLFQNDVMKIKTDGAKLNLVNEVTKKWNYGKDPHKGCNLGKTKSLPRTCSSLIRKHLSPKWIPQNCKLDYCVLSKGKNGCCINPDDYRFGDPLNFTWLVQQRFGLNKLDPENQDKVTQAVMRDIADEKTENCKLDIIIDIFVLTFYMKRVKQDRLSKSMDIDGNDYRISYAPEILIKVSDDIIMMIRCPESCVGVGFWNLVKWKANDDGKMNVNKDEIHSMIHICDAYESMSKIEILFGVKGTANIQDIEIKISNEDGPITLYPIQQPMISDSNIHSSSNSHESYTISNKKRSSLSNTDNNGYNPSFPPSKRRKLN